MRGLAQVIFGERLESVIPWHLSPRRSSELLSLELVNDRQIPRCEAETIRDILLSDDGPKSVLVVGPAGRGKSCVMTQVASLFFARPVPHLCLRVDEWPERATTRSLGMAHLGLPASPAAVLAGMANGRKCVLVVDQLNQ